MAFCWCVTLLVWTAAAAASPLAGNVRRYAVVIGSDRGNKEATALRHAEADALKMFADGLGVV
jgi:hypothetical protein